MVAPEVSRDVAIDGTGSSTPIIWEDRVFLLTAIDTGIVDPSLPKPEDQPDRVFGINLSGDSINDSQLLSFILEEKARTGISLTNVCFEVTESAILSNVQHAQRFIEVLHGIGCEFSLDDFGSALGSFSSLKHLPIDYLKIDGTYTRNLHTDLVNQEMVAAMIRLARTMEFRIVAEQVEHQEDFDWLREIGVDFVQGNFIDAPATLGSGATGTYRTINS